MHDNGCILCVRNGSPTGSSVDVYKIMVHKTRLQRTHRVMTEHSASIYITANPYLLESISADSRVIGRLAAHSLHCSDPRSSALSQLALET